MYINERIYSIIYELGLIAEFFLSKQAVRNHFRQEIFSFQTFGWTMVFSSIQGLRAIAALMVVASHAVGGGNGETPNILAAGVDIFFVVSGFVMVVSTSAKKYTFSRFISARIIRIVPPYWVATALAALIVVLDSHNFPTVGELAKALFFIPYTDPRNGQPNPILGVGWTLNYEMFFYLLFGLTLWLNRRKQLSILAGIFLILVALRPIIGHFGALPLRITSPLFFEFLAGAIVGSSLPSIRRQPLITGYFLICIGLCSAVAANIIIPNAPRTFVFGIPATFIVAGAVINEKLFHLKNLSFLMLLGDASYSIYLFHGFPIEILSRKINSGIPFLDSFLLFILAVVVGILGYFIIERPLLQGIRKLTSSPASSPSSTTKKATVV